MRSESAKRWGPGIAGLAVAGVLPVVTGPYVTTFVFSLLIALVLAQSWDWIGGQMGYINLGHFAFYGIGAYAFAISVIGGISPVGAAVIGVAAALLVAAVVCFPLFRLRGDYFAFATLALLPVCELLAYNLSWLTGGATGIPLPPNYVLVPAYYLALGLATATLLLSTRIERSRFGYALDAIRNDEEVAAVAGIRILPIKIWVLGLTAMFAAMAGMVQTWQLGYLDPPSAFGLEAGLIPIAMALLGGSGLLWGPLVGVAILGVAHELLLVKLTMLQTTIYGVVILLVGRFMPGGLLRARWSGVSSLRVFGLRVGEEARATDDCTRIAWAPSAPADQVVRYDRPLLECRHLTMAFGGNRAVDNVTLAIRPGEIVGLVGPNGSGKTTLFNCISKVYEPLSGELKFGGRSLRNLRRDTASRLGIGRTYQVPRPFSDLTVQENITIPLLFRDGTARDMRGAHREAREIAAFVGLKHQLSTRADALSLQEKKALELARALACKPKLLLIDEVASGLTPAEVRGFIDLLRQVRDDQGTTIIWVEHIFWALAELVDRLIVMENGSILADGELKDVIRDRDVVRAYLGAHSSEAAPC